MMSVADDRRGPRSRLRAHGHASRSLFSSLGTALFLLALPLLLGACGELTAGGLGEATVVVSGGEELQFASDSGSTPSTVAARVAGPMEGEVRARLRVYLEAPDGSEIELTDQEGEAVVDIQGTTEAKLATAPLEEGRYPEIRIVFSEIEADVRRGLVIAGQEITGRVPVDFGPVEELEVTRTLDLRISEGDRVEVLIDLNTSTWLRAANPALQVVAAAVFRNAVDVRVR